MKTHRRQMANAIPPPSQASARGEVPQWDFRRKDALFLGRHDKCDLWYEYRDGDGGGYEILRIVWGRGGMGFSIYAHESDSDYGLNASRQDALRECGRRFRDYMHDPSVSPNAHL